MSRFVIHHVMSWQCIAVHCDVSRTCSNPSHVTMRDTTCNGSALHCDVCHVLVQTPVMSRCMTHVMAVHFTATCVTYLFKPQSCHDAWHDMSWQCGKLRLVSRTCLNPSHVMMHNTLQHVMAVHCTATCHVLSQTPVMSCHAKACHSA